MKYYRTPIACPACGKTFIPDHLQARSLAVGRQKVACCSRECYRKHCSKKFEGTGNPGWRGGCHIKQGYRFIFDPDRSRRAGHGNHIQEHIALVERALGRSLRSNEVVHHLNGDSTDNRPNNLRVMDRRQHASLHMKARHAERRSAE